MPETLPLVRDQRTIDTEHLKLLAVFHFIFAGLAILGILFLIAHYLIMSTLTNNPKFWQNQNNANFDPRMIFQGLKWVYLFSAVLFVAGGIANLLSGLFIRAKKHRVYSLVIAGIDCLQVPFGTALGVCTFIVLFRDSVKQAYGEGGTPTQGQPGSPPLS